jgi:hypothetical protein
MRARNGRAALSAALLLVLTGWAPAGASALSEPQAAHGSGPDPTIGPLIAGTEAYVDGTHVWTDYA